MPRARGQQERVRARKAVHKIGGSGEWDVGLWAGLDSLHVGGRVRFFARSRFEGFLLWKARARLAGFIFRPTWEFSTCESRDDIHGLGVLRSSRPALGIKWSRHLRDVERMELSSLTERALHNRRRQDMVGSFLGRELVASRFSIAVPLLPMGRCQDRVPSAMSGPSVTYLHISNSTMLFTDAEPQPTMMLHAGYGLGIRQFGRYPLTCG